jgi:23S rRNA (cytosine1962-C5)-methyltransferase
MSEPRKPSFGPGPRSGGPRSGPPRQGGGSPGGSHRGPPPQRNRAQSARDAVSANRPVVRRGVVRLPPEIAARVAAGHPWIYREVLQARPLREHTGAEVELVDGSGEFIGRGLYEEGAIIAVRVVTRESNESIGPGLVTRRVQSAIALRKQLVPADVEAYRLVNAENDGLPGITVDRYGAYLVVHFFTPAVLGLRDALYDALIAELKPRGIYEQKRFRPLAGEAPRGPAELVRGDAAPVEFEVKEGPLTFLVDVTAPLSTGLFLDLREGRRRVAAWAKGRRALNLFSYTGAISVWAQQGGATEVVAVDVAAKAHARARRNFVASGMDGEKPEHIVGDAFKVLAKFAERGRKFDMVVLDPPAFGTAGKGQVFSAAQDYRDLIEASLGALAPGGVLCAVSSTHKISVDEFDRMLAEGAARAKCNLRIVERPCLPPDFCVAPGFPEGNYLKFVIAIKE